MEIREPHDHSVTIADYDKRARVRSAVRRGKPMPVHAVAIPCAKCAVLNRHKIHLYIICADAPLCIVQVTARGRRQKSHIRYATLFADAPRRPAAIIDHLFHYTLLYPEMRVAFVKI
jgi:hypothetical protein